MNNKILVIVAHADDEAIGCGGTIARHTAQGDSVELLILADGVTSRTNSDSADLANRQSATDLAQTVLGIRQATYLGFTDNSLDSVPLLHVVHQIEPVMRRVEPDIVYTHHVGDLNIDHRITHQATMTACRPLPGQSVKEIYTFEVVSSTEWNSPFLYPFVPQLFVDITDHLDTKLKALEAYKIEMRPAPHSRSVEHIRALAIHRGHSAGVSAAEAFMVMRINR